MKRRAPCDIEREKLERGEFSDDEAEKPDLGKISTKEEIAQRKILKIKGPKQGGAEQPQDTKFQLSANLQNIENPDENKTFTFIKDNNENKNTVNIFDNSKAQVSLNVNAGKPIEIPDRDKMKVAEDLDKISSGQVKPVFSGLFNNNTEPKKEEPKKQETNSGGLFGNISKESKGGLFGSSDPKPASGGLFGNSVNVFANQNQSTEQPKQGLFGNNTNNQQSSGLFGGNNKPASGIFSQNTSQQKEENKTENRGGLFANLQQNNNNNGLQLQQNQNQGGFLKIGQNQEGGEEDEEDDNAQVSGQNTPEIDKTKTKQFEYADIMEKLQEKAVLKFKKNTNETQDKGHVSIEQLKGKPDSQVILVYRNNLKQIMYQGTIMKGISTQRTLNNNEQNLCVNAVTQETDDAGKPKFTKDTLKIQFGAASDGTSFKEAIQKILD